MKRLLLIALCFVAAPYVADRFARTGVSLSHWPDGSVRSRSTAKQYPDGRVERDGPFVAFHSNGQKFQEGVFDHGRRHGTWRSWYESGAPYAEGNYDHGDGILTSYFENGGKQAEGPYHEGKRHGHWREWDQNGALRKEGEYRDGLLHGRWQYWNPGGDPEHEEIVWDRGRAQIAGEEVVTAASTDAPPGPIVHLGQCLLMLLVMLGPIPLGLTLLARGRQRRAPTSALHCQICLVACWLTIQTLIGLVLGWLHLLTPTGLAAAEIVMLLAGIGSLRFSALVSPVSPVSPVFAVSPARLDSAAFTLSAAPSLLGLLRDYRPRPDWSVTEMALLMGLLITGGALLWNGLTVPMSDWDSLAYHLPVVARWYQEGHFVGLPELGQVGRYPFNLEALTALLVLPFGEDLLVGLPPVLAWALMTMAMIGLARRRGTTRAEALATALLLGSIPLVLLQAEELRADLTLMAVFLASLYLGGMFQAGSAATPSRPVQQPVLWLLCLGLLAGLKVSGPLYALLSLAGVAVWHWWAAGWPRKIRSDGQSPLRRTYHSLIPVVLTLLACCLLAGGWYVRNLAELGNPFGFAQVTLLGRELWSGSLAVADLARSTLASIFDPGRVAHWNILWGVTWRWLGLPFLALAALGLVGLAGGLLPFQSPGHGSIITATRKLSAGLPGRGGDRCRGSDTSGR